MSNKVITTRSRLFQAAIKANTVVRERVIIPINSSLLFDIKGSIMSVTGTNNETQCRAFLSCESESTFSFCCPASLMVESLKLMSTDDISIELQEGRILMKNGRDKYTIPIYPAEDFNVLRIKGDIEKVILPIDVFVESIRKCTYFIDPTHYVEALHGASIKVIGQNMIIAASNGNNVFRTFFKVDNPSNVDIDILASIDFCYSLSKTNPQGELSLCAAEGKVMINNDEIRLTGITKNGGFPNIDRFWKNKCPDGIKINTNNLKNAIAKIKLYVVDGSGIVRFDFSKDEVKITGDYEEYGKGGIIEMMCYNEIDKHTGFNATSIGTVVSLIDSPDLMMHTSGPSDIVFVGPAVQDENYNYEFMISPLKVNKTK